MATRWRYAFAATETLQRIRPEHTDAELPNPHRGWATFQRFAGDPLERGKDWNDAVGPVSFATRAPRRLVADGDFPSTVAYCRWPWGVLEPRPGRIRFDILDQALATAARHGQTLQMRVQPFVYADLPKWFVATGAPMKEIGTCPAGPIWEPDANDARYIRHWSRFIAALGKRYDGHPMLESFDVAYAGRFGEMGGNATPVSAARLADAYLAAFRRTTLLSMISTHGCRHAAARNRPNVGWRGDGFFDPKNQGRGKSPDHLCWNHMWDVYPVDIFDYGVADLWQRSPMTLEPHGTLQHVLEAGWRIEPLLEACCKYHPSIFMHKSVRVPAAYRGAVEAFVRRLGYRFHLHQMTLPLEAKPGQKIETTVTIDNKGIAPIYRPYTFALRFSQGTRHAIVPFQQDIRAWMPDYSSFRETFALPRTLQRGEAKVACSIITDGQPVVRLAIKNITKDGWHPLTSIDVL